ncbi:L,D-transpeptidase family protein [Streptomyces showdoensis]|uniref:Lipoprotein n=1 Tax=Streptomyces showdoensis TaxID=68268 RepID=A0A2P2GIN7_STREW|nr:L,D-transpeptidase family protein [Streptomyces showdoensis]KKZ71337.1 lipoprotein [Streptomyces showdoensis]
MPVRKGTATVLTCALSAALVLTGCTAGRSPAPPPSAARDRHDGRDAGAVPDGANRAPRERQRPPRAPERIAGIGPVTQARIPDGTTQVLVASGDAADGNVVTAVLHERDPAGHWHPVAGPWAGHNALRGWTDAHQAGDLRSPTGVYRIGDAGGRLPDPGARVPYDQDEEFEVSGTGFLGEPLEGSFDYVVAIDYNRVAGTTPLNKERPLGPERGGGVWIHVDHGGPTQACVSLPRENMAELLRALDPAREPVVVMGPRDEIAR